MSRQVVIDVPDWVDDSLAEKLKEMLIAKIREEIERDYTDMKLYKHNRGDHCRICSSGK